MAMAAEKINNTNQITETNHQQQEEQTCFPCKTFVQKCDHFVKNQRAKFYIFRRCIMLLLCWNESSSD
ncbi:hypothetical protein MtrunA17_Chr1g0180861 [Medicago truncatula]|uniref:DVL family protein n=1 Tax=Medicago truncatula TaxID=3880 RepID=G7IA86_MEDTR|nr:DVL family protein [Medicago truncatula]RHN79762.1 hypothetical protein MtrunA17_Chr1g0180861 [Medicago truncatula]